MSDVKRYEIVLDSRTLSAKQANDGEWCDYSEVAPLLAELAAIKAERKALLKSRCRPQPWRCHLCKQNTVVDFDLHNVVKKMKIAGRMWEVTVPVETVHRCPQCGPDSDTISHDDQAQRAALMTLASRLQEFEKAGLANADGTPKVVAGVLPTLADGSLWGGLKYEDLVRARLWAVHPHDGEVIECFVTPEWSQLDDWRVVAAAKSDSRCFPLSWCYSTREAAIAARKEK